MADKQISDLTAATGLTDGSLFVIEQSGAAKSANWAMMKEYLSPSIAPQYSNSAIYNVGDYVIYNGSLYRCVVDITTAEAWTAAHWQATTIGTEVTDLIGALNPDNADNILALIPSSTVTKNGVTGNYAAGRITLSGTAGSSGAPINIWPNTSGLPEGINPGETLFVKVAGATSTQRLNVRFYNGSTITGTDHYLTADATITVPSNATAVLIRIWVSANTVASGTISVSILKTLTNKELADAVDALGGLNAIGNALIIGEIGATTDINDLTGNKCVLLVSSYSYANAPFSLGTVFNLDFSATLSVQFGYQFTTGELFYRRKSTTWGDWKSLTPNTVYQTGTKYVAFGDSISYGAVWSPTQGTALHQVTENWRIPTRIAIATGMVANFSNEAIGGIGYLKEQDGQNLKTQIYNYDFSGVELVTIMAGANDKSTKNLGTYSDASTENTICGAIRYIIETIASKAPRAQIIIIQPTPSGVNGNTDDVWTTIPSGWKWSMNQFDEQVSQLCANEHVGYVSWNDSTYCRNWSCVGYNDSVGPNYTHPTVDFDYCRLGDFIGGKVSALFKGLA